MKKNFFALISLFVMAATHAAPVVVTPGSAAGYLYFPSATTSAAASGGSNVNGGTNKFLFKLADSTIGAAGRPYYVWCTEAKCTTFDQNSMLAPTFAQGRTKALSIQYMGTGNFTPTSTGANTGKFSGAVQRSAVSAPGAGGAVTDACTWKSTQTLCPAGYTYSYSAGTYYGSGVGFCVHSYASGWISYQGNGDCYTVNVVELDVVEVSKM